MDWTRLDDDGVCASIDNFCRDVRANLALMRVAGDTREDLRWIAGLLNDSVIDARTMKLDSLTGSLGAISQHLTDAIAAGTYGLPQVCKLCDSLIQRAEFDVASLTEKIQQGSAVALAPEELTVTEFSQISGLSKSAASKLSNKDLPLTLTEARRIRDARKASRRSNRDETDAEIERKFNDQ